MPSNRLEVLLTANVKPFNDGLRQVQRDVDRTMGNIVRQAQGASQALGILAAGGGLLTKSFLDSASQMQQFEATLTAVTGSAADAKAQLKEMTEFAAKTPFELPSVVSAGVKLRALGVDVDKFLPLAGNLAAVMGRDIPDAAQALGKAASGSQDGITQLADSFGVTKRELIAAGAAMGEGGAIAVSTAADIERLQAALQKVVGTKFGGAMEAQSKTLKGAFSNLSDAIGQLKADLGQSLAPAAETVARSITKLVESLRALPDWVKQTAAFGTVAATALLGFGAAVSGAVVVFGPLIGQIASLTSKFPALTASVGGTGTAAIALSAAFVATTTAMVALGAAAAVYITLLEQQNKASQTLLETELKRAEGLRKHHELLGKSSEELRKQGATAKDVSEMIMGYQEAAEQARARGDQAAAQRASDEIRRLKEIQASFAATEATKRAEDAKTKAAQDVAEKRAEEFKKKRTAGVFESSKAELDAMDSVLSGLSKQSKYYEEFSLERIKLAREVAKEEADASEKARKEKLDSAKHEVDLLGVQSDRNKAKQIAALQEILKSYKLSSDEKAQIELQLAKLESDLVTQQAQDRKRADDERKKRAEDIKKQAEAAHEAQSRLLKAQEESSDVAISSLEQRLSRGEDVLAQLEAEIVKRGELREKIIAENAAKSVSSDPKNASTIARAAEEAKRAEAAKTAEELEKVQRAQQEKTARAAADEASIQEKSAKLKEEALKRELDAGGRNKSAYLSALRERQRAEQQALESRAAAESAGKSGAELDRVQRQYNLDLLELRRQQTEELSRANRELDKANKSSRKMTGAVLSLEEFVKQSNETDSSSGDPLELADARKARQQIESGLSSLPEVDVPLSKSLAGGRGASGASGGSGGNNSYSEALDLMRQILAAITGASGGRRLATEGFDWQHSPNRLPRT